MKNTVLNKTRLVALTLAAATLITPFYASAQNFSGQNFSSRNNSNAGAQIAGGLIGGSLGAIVGEEIAGRRNRTEGAVIGAIVGGVTGAAIGEGIADNGNRNRRFNNRGFTNNRFGNRGFNSRNFGNTGFTTRIAHNGRGFRDNRGFRNDPSFGRRTTAREYYKIDKIDYRIDMLKYEQEDIYAQIEYNGPSRRLKNRLHYIDCEIAELKDRRRFLKRKAKRNQRRFFRAY